MVDRALADKAAVEAQIAQGVSRREALAPYLSDENFDAWFQDFSKALRQVVGQSSLSSKFVPERGSAE